MSGSRTLVWLSPWHSRSGISTYSHALLPAIQAHAPAGWQVVRLEADDLEGRDLDVGSLLQAVQKAQPSIIHIQHEYGHWGGKMPPRYRFFQFVQKVRQHLPHAKLSATAHTVLPPDYRFPLKGNGVERVVRRLTNRFALPPLQRLWTEQTWGALDQVLVHSEQQQLQLSKRLPATTVHCIPHFVYDPLPLREPSAAVGAWFKAGRKVLLVFGFVTPSKGQSEAIELLAQIAVQHPEAHLLLAGGARTSEDQAYEAECRRRVVELGLNDRVTFTGYVDSADVPFLMTQATVVLAPFRETTGSGSIPMALAYGAPVLASDLPLNRELAARVEPEAVGHLNVQTLAEALQGNGLELLRRGSKAYAARFSLAETARRHWKPWQGTWGLSG